jgi:hypothetical protein
MDVKIGSLFPPVGWVGDSIGMAIDLAARYSDCTTVKITSMTNATGLKTTFVRPGFGR